MADDRVVAVEANGGMLRPFTCCAACEPALRALRAEADRLREANGALQAEVTRLRAQRKE